ncbi:MFS transporter [Granulicella sp. 5B5]|uniref:spinster family MFS transporter n=1 Tax=Granulicella sp. 5B5 TaxID=1617967 RepID=UPI0021075E40|nr:MFS transporter [Granulicella sp. 5B5]
MKRRSGAVAGATVALVLLTAMNFVNYLDRYILPAVQEQVKGDFHLSDAQIGALTFWFFVAYVGASPITGWLGDRFSRKPMIVIAALAIAAMNFFTASVHDYWSLNLRHALLGIGEASFGIFAPALLADFYSERDRNRVLTIFNMALPFGAAMGFEAGAWVGGHYGWRMSFISSAVPGAVIGLLIWFLMKEPVRTGGSTTVKVERAGALSLLKNPAYLCAILGYAAVTFSLGGISWWMPSFLHRVAGYSIEAAGGVMGPIIVVAGLGGTALGGWIAQVWSKKTAKALYLVPALSALLTVPPAMLCFFGPTKFIVPSLSVAVFLVFLGTGPVNAATLNAVPANLRAMAMAGQLFALHVFGDMSSPTLIGIVSDHSNLRLGLGLTLVTFVIGAGIFFLGTRYAPELHDDVPEVVAA